MPSQAAMLAAPGRYARANGLNIFYKSYGQGTPLVMLHGSFDCTHEMWAWQLPLFARHFRVIAPDARGHGRTGNPAEKITLSLLADDVMNFCRSLKLDLPILCGISMGGRTALTAAMRYPGAFRAVIAGAAQVHRPFPASMLAQMRSIGIFGPGQVDPGIIETNDSQRAAQLRARHCRSPGQWKELLRSLSYVWNETPPPVDDYSKITVPVLLAAGDRDHIVRVEDVVEAYRALPKAELAVLPGHDHCSFFCGKDNPFNRIVLDFLARNMNGR